MASPRFLLYALHPWLGEGDWTADRRVEMPVSGVDRAAADRVLAAAGIGDAPFVILAPAGHSSDRWPAERFGDLAARLAAELGVSVLVEGAPRMSRCCARWRSGPASCAGDPRVRIATDPLGVLAALLERARLLVGNDSAPIHVAEAAGTPTLYFAHREKLLHSHPAGEACWALYRRGAQPARRHLCRAGPGSRAGNDSPSCTIAVKVLASESSEQFSFQRASYRSRRLVPGGDRQ